VIPLFQQQIAAGGPVTVTDRAVVRYFMTIQEAVQLILCAGTMALGGETFVLDMGKPRNILELARQMILLSGMEPGIDIETKITGLRPGEKLTEELAGERESLRPTRFEKLSVIEPQPCDALALAADIRRLVQAAKLNDSSQVRQVLQAMGLGFTSGIIEVGTAAAADRTSLGMRGQFQMAPPGVLSAPDPLQAD
jgi:FlaA1/EpsC-like NDP-sugar epimerase